MNEFKKAVTGMTLTATAGALVLISKGQGYMTIIALCGILPIGYILLANIIGKDREEKLAKWRGHSAEQSSAPKLVKNKNGNDSN